MKLDVHIILFLESKIYWLLSKKILEYFLEKNIFKIILVSQVEYTNELSFASSNSSSNGKFGACE